MCEGQLLSIPTQMWTHLAPHETSILPAHLRTQSAPEPSSRDGAAAPSEIEHPRRFQRKMGPSVLLAQTECKSEVTPQTSAVCHYFSCYNVSDAKSVSVARSSGGPRRFRCDQLHVAELWQHEHPGPFQRQNGSRVSTCTQSRETKESHTLQDSSKARLKSTAKQIYVTGAALLPARHAVPSAHLTGNEGDGSGETRLCHYTRIHASHLAASTPQRVRDAIHFVPPRVLDPESLPFISHPPPIPERHPTRSARFICGCFFLSPSQSHSCENGHLTSRTALTRTFAHMSGPLTQTDTPVSSTNSSVARATQTRCLDCRKKARPGPCDVPTSQNQSNSAARRADTGPVKQYRPPHSALICAVWRGHVRTKAPGRIQIWS